MRLTLARVERKLATILFADLVGSTELGASLDPEYARDLLDRFYDAMEAEIALGGGTIEKFIGDAVVAVFGAPAAQEDHAERALQVALWMQERLQELFGGRLSLQDRRQFRRGRGRPASRGQLVRDRRRGERGRAPRTGGGARPRTRRGAHRVHRRRRVRARRAADGRGEREGGRSRLQGAPADARAAAAARRARPAKRDSWVASRSSNGSRTCSRARRRTDTRGSPWSWVRRAWARRPSSASSGSACRAGRRFGSVAASPTAAA